MNLCVCMIENLSCFYNLKCEQYNVLCVCGFFVLLMHSFIFSGLQLVLPASCIEFNLSGLQSTARHTTLWLSISSISTIQSVKTSQSVIILARDKHQIENRNQLFNLMNEKTYKYDDRSFRFLYNSMSLVCLNDST